MMQIFAEDVSPTIRNMSYLVQKARENDQEALTEIYKISSPAVYKTIWVLTKMKIRFMISCRIHM